MIAAKLGELLAPLSREETGRLGGRGKKGGSPTELPFAKEALAHYRTLARHAARIDEYGKKGGRGNKATTPTVGAFQPNTISHYRTLARHAARIEEYRQKVDASNEVLPDDHPDLIEISTAGLLRYGGGSSMPRVSFPVGPG